MTTATRTLLDNIAIGLSQYSGAPTARYVVCPRCRGELHRYPRVAWPHGYRLFGKCLNCTYAAWEHEESAAILARLVAAQQYRNDVVAVMAGDEVRV